LNLADPLGFYKRKAIHMEEAASKAGVGGGKDRRPEDKISISVHGDRSKVEAPSNADPRGDIV
jgi:hypothetical protein